jgi:predicted transcriptional regulator of viral defense system
MSDERPFTHLLCGQIHVRDVSSDDEAIARLARPQHGIVARGQLKDLGISERAIDHRAAAGRLRRLHPGVYAVGHEALSYTARVQSAVLSVAPGAATSHTTAAALWKLGDPPHGWIHVTAARKRTPKRGVAIHRGILPREDVTILDGIPVTTVPRTLLDVSATGNPSALRRLVKQAEFERLTDTAALAAILERYPRRRGRGSLAGIVNSYIAAAGQTRSEFEDLFLEFIERRDLPRPETSAIIEVAGRTFEVDCAWRDARVIVELDGIKAHRTDGAFHEDRARDRALIAAGWLPMRVTWPQLRHDADTLEAEIRAALRGRSPTNVGSPTQEVGRPTPIRGRELVVRVRARA